MKIITSQKITKEANSASFEIAKEAADFIKKKIRELNPMDRERDWEITAWVIANLQEILQNRRPY